MDYIRPLSIEAAVEAAQSPGAVFLAGGTDLVLHMREGKAQPEMIIDLGRLAELKRVAEVDGNLEIGSMATFAELGRNPLIEEKAHALWQACQTMGSPQIRNQATLGGNLGNCSPAADGLPPLLALGAVVCLVGPDGEQRIPLTELLGRTPLFTQGILVKKFIIPITNRVSGFHKLGRRRALAIARLSVAVSLEIDGLLAKDVKVALGAVGKRAYLADSLGQSLSGREITDEWIEEAVAGSKAVVRDALGTRASAPYKRAAVCGVMREALASCGVQRGGR